MAQYSDTICQQPETLARPDLATLMPYQSARRIAQQAGIVGEVWLNANESAVYDSMTLTTDAFNRYPEPQPEGVVQGYATYAGVTPEQVLVTRGGDEGIELLIRTFCRPGVDCIAQFAPTYGMYSVSAQTNGVGVINIITDPSLGWIPDPEAAAQILNDRPEVQILFTCSPGNPTGNLIPLSVLQALAEVTIGRCLLVIDEAYIDFSPESTAKGLLAQYPHVVLIRTLSKAFALAGLRCGFVLANPKVITMLKKVIAPYPIPVPVSNLAEQALSDAGVQRMRDRASNCIQARSELIEGLKSIPGIDAVYPTDANFILVRLTKASQLFDALRQRGIVLRDQSKQPTLENCIRITVGTPDENRRLLQAMTEIFQELT